MRRRHRYRAKNVRNSLILEIIESDTLPAPQVSIPRLEFRGRSRCQTTANHVIATYRYLHYTAQQKQQQKQQITCIEYVYHLKKMCIHLWAIDFAIRSFLSLLPLIPQLPHTWRFR